MLIATWFRLKLTRSLNLPENIFRHLKLSVIDWMRFGLLTWLLYSNFPERNLGVRYLFVAVDSSSHFLWVVGVKSKTSKACSEALKIFIAINKQRNAPKVCATKKYPEKIWADQGKDFAGAFAKFCKDNGIKIYSTRSETKSAVAERYIRTSKTIILKYLLEFDTNRCIDQLEKFVSMKNNGINRMTNLAPIEVSQKDVPYLISLCNTVSPKRPKFNVGDRVRIRRKIETVHRSYRIQFTEMLYTVSDIPTKKPPTYFLKDINNGIIQGKFYEPELVKFVTTNWRRR